MSRAIPDTICLCGPDGAGKSTQADALVAWLRGRSIAARVCSPWDLLASGGLLQTKGEVHAFLSTLHGAGRALLLHLAVRESLDRALEARSEGEILVVVGYFLKYSATERALGADRALMDALAASFPPLSLLLYLDLSPEAALERKSDPSRYECGGEGKGGFIPFQRRAQRELSLLLAAHGGDRWKIVDGSAPSGEVARAIEGHVSRWLEAR